MYTDNNPLTYVMTTAKLNATGLRWVATLSNYQFVIKYRPGKLNIDADGLSRCPLDWKVAEKVCTERIRLSELDEILSVAASCTELTTCSESVDVNLIQLEGEVPKTIS